MAGCQLQQLDSVQLSLKTVRRRLADINWQGVPQSDCTRKEGLIVHACVVLERSIRHLRP